MYGASRQSRWAEVDHRGGDEIIQLVAHDPCHLSMISVTNCQEKGYMVRNWYSLPLRIYLDVETN